MGHAVNWITLKVAELVGIKARFAGNAPPLAKEPKALGYVKNRQSGLQLSLGETDATIDTNHLEQALRPNPRGRKNWLFNWSERGTRHFGVIQSLLMTCQLHDVNPYTHLVDVLQRSNQQAGSTRPFQEFGRKGSMATRWYQTSGGWANDGPKGTRDDRIDIISIGEMSRSASPTENSTGSTTKRLALDQAIALKRICERDRLAY